MKINVIIITDKNCGGKHMNIKSINFSNSGYVFCQSSFGSMHCDLDSNRKFSLSQGVNILSEEIDSDAWATSYALSMYNHKPKDFTLFEKPEVVLNNKIAISLNEFCEHSCYLDLTYPMFSTKTPVKKLIIRALKTNVCYKSLEEIQELFGLDSNRLERPLSSVGNEAFRAMAAIGYSSGKQVFCFPWMSQKRFQYYNNNVTQLLEILKSLDKTVILPLGQ